MSSSPAREPLSGLILQGDRIVGGLNLPNPPDEFLREFHSRYGHLGLRVVPNERNSASALQGESPPDSKSQESGIRSH
jgi:hypothetical protein